MAYRKVNYRDVEPVADAMHFLREPLDSDQLGVTFVRCKPGWVGMKHDHADNEHEEVYVLIEGEATVTVEEEDVAMEPGDAIWIPPEATRQIRNGDRESVFLLVSAPGEIESPDDDEDWVLRGFQG